MKRIEEIMRMAPVIPVLVIDEIAHAAPIAEALVDGGLPVLEVTLRTPHALGVLREMKSVEGAIVGAGTVLNPEQLDDALRAGAEFIVAPGLTQPLGRAAVASGAPFLPGVANAADIMRGFDLHLCHFKFFPAEANGGVEALRALSAVFGDAHFCPTGGIDEENAPDWLALESVLCVGGSWPVPKGVPNLEQIRGAAARARELVA